MKRLWIAPAFVLLCALSVTGCSQPFGNRPNEPSAPDPNLLIEGGVLKGYNGTPSGILVIPADVTEIADYAFSGRTGLTGVDFSSCINLKKIGDGAFLGCTGIKGTIVFPANLETIGASAFYMCGDIDDFDFSRCTKLSSIGSWAFGRCTKIKAVNLPASLTNIAGDAFDECPELATLTVHSDNKFFKSKGNIIYNSDETEAACSARAIQSIDFPKNLVKITKGAFKGCAGLTALDLPDSVKILDFQSFYGCKEIKGTVVLPKSLKTIGIGTFGSCENVGSFDFSKCTGLTSIGSGAFGNCTKIKAVNLPAKLKDFVGDAFVSCTELAMITVDSNNEFFTVKDNTIYDKGQTKLVCSARTIPSFKFPADLTEIGRGAFSGCTKLTAVDLSSCTDLTTIDVRAFFECTGLTQLILPVNLKTIDEFAFFVCREISGTVVLPANLEKIGDNAFFQCNKVTNFDFSKCTELTSIGSGAFTECKAAVFTVKKDSVGSAIKSKLMANGVAENQIMEVD